MSGLCCMEFFTTTVEKTWMRQNKKIVYNVFNKEGEGEK